jgi:hypothetical protein
VLVLLVVALAACRDEGEVAAAAPECRATPTSIDSTARAELIAARDAVWRAYYAADSAGLVRILPEPMIGMHTTRAEIIAEAQEGARGGRRLVGLDFTCDEFFLSGDVAVVYSNYRTEVEEDGKRSVKTGRAIELFERRDGRWLNPSWHLDEG